MPNQYRALPLTERFWTKVRKDGPPHPYTPSLGPCWPWTASTNHGGYGTFGLNGASVLAHRLAYEWEVGALPPDMCALHSCDNPPCVNPAHLFAGTRTDNNHDKGRKHRGRSREGDDHWTRLHPGRALKGEGHGRALFTDAEVLAMRALYAGASLTIRAIAARFASNEITVGQIVRRKTWRHLP